MEIHGPARLPLTTRGETVEFNLWYYDTGQGRWTAAIVGDPSPEYGPMPLRIESACVFGHVFGSVQCDCGFQLEEAMSRITRLCRGMVIYAVDQDARGAGMAAHFDIYKLRQQDGLDTDEVFERLGAPWDGRDYEPVLEILAHHNVTSVRLLTNNDSREKFLRNNGIEVSREPLEAELSVYNMSTLMLEKEDLGYRWTFYTHADHLELLQAEVVGTAKTAAGFSAPGERPWITVVRDGVWGLGESVAEELGARRSRNDPTDVLYLTDFPRLDEIPGYADLSVQVIVVPFPRIPALLSECARRHGVRVVDWARHNAYTEPRPQWVPVHAGEDYHVYTREDRVRVVRVSPGDTWPEVRWSATESHDRWREFAADADQVVAAVAGTAATEEVADGMAVRASADHQDR